MVIEGDSSQSLVPPAPDSQPPESGLECLSGLSPALEVWGQVYLGSPLSN